MPTLKFKLPALPFRKSQAQDGAVVDEDDDDLDYLEPTRLQKHAPWIAVGLAYLLVLGGIAGTVTYLALSAAAIEEDMKAMRPSVTLERITIGETRTVAADDSEPAAEDDQTVADALSVFEDDSADDAAEDDDTQADTGEQPPEDPADMAEPEKTADAAEPEAEQAGEEDAREPDAFGRSLLPHPDPSLVEQTDNGPLPKVADDGRNPWRAYSRPFNVLEASPKIAIVVTDLGVSPERTEKALKLPGSVTLAFAPYANNLEDWIQKARDAGHEVMLTLPMEPYDYPKSDPGPFALMTSLDLAENMDKLTWVMSRATGYVGFVNFLGSKMTTNEAALKPMFQVIKDRGLLYLDDGSTPISRTGELAQQLNLPMVKADMVLDNPPGRSLVLGKLRELETEARTNGVAVAVAHPYPATLDRLDRWAQDLGGRDLTLIPVSAVVAGNLRGS